ncbi:tyrosine-type recombinase/integrase [Bailinhaonella thermotolerans]|uniref:Integrase n=1 Tax=Bailinhaonella thermotolerans TaxID=1070861 RepID=A0A3A4A3Z9_9ACTN|nr:tyrosine-type recombinase/integrase [Bailinhaonella thermotolerans]RJL23205.1 integrase [Bailinhaonella thermotolerans]
MSHDDPRHDPPALAVPAEPAPLPPGRNPYHVYLDTLAATSRTVMRSHLDRIARLLAADTGHPAPEQLTGADLDWHRLRYEHTARIRTLVAGRTTGRGRPPSPADINQHIAALRGVLAAAWRLGLMTTDDYHRARDLRPAPGSRVAHGQHVPRENIGALLAACDADDNQPLAARDAAMIAVLAAAGLRRAETAALDLAAYRRRDRALRVLGKGDKEQDVPLPSWAVARLEAWLAIRGHAPGPLFPRFRKGGRFTLDAPHLTGQSIQVVIDRRARQAGLLRDTPAFGEERIRAHDMRRTFVGELLDAGVDLATAQRLARHAKPETTSRYDHRGERRLREAVAQVPPPKPVPLRGGPGDAASGRP